MRCHRKTAQAKDDLFDHFGGGWGGRLRVGITLAFRGNCARHFKKEDIPEKLRTSRGSLLLAVGI